MRRQSKCTGCHGREIAVVAPLSTPGYKLVINSFTNALYFDINHHGESGRASPMQYLVVPLPSLLHEGGAQCPAERDQRQGRHARGARIGAPAN